MKYRNTRTGFEIDAACEISGGDWEPIEAPRSTSDHGADDAAAEKKPAKKSTKKKD